MSGSYRASLSPQTSSVARDAGELRALFEQGRDEILQASNDEEIRRRSCFLITHLYQAAVALVGSEEAFCATYPEHSGELLKARHWSEYPTSHIGHLLPFLRTFGRWVIKETELLRGGNGFALPRWRRVPRTSAMPLYPEGG